MAKSLNNASILQAMDDLVATKPGIGYSQGLFRRRTCIDPKTLKWQPGKDGDCSFISFAVMLVAGLVVSSWRTLTLFSGNIVNVLVKTGYYRKIDVSKNRTLGALKAALHPGDVMAGPGHVIVVRDAKRWLSWEHNELGTEDGGHTGWQKGEKTGWRAPYMRPRGWAAVARLIPVTDFQGRILAAYAKGKSYTDLLTKLTVRASADGPLWKAFMATVARLTAGSPVLYNAPVAPTSGHAYVVLGGSVDQMTHRCQLALAGLQANPNSLVVVTGAPVRADNHTEGAWMRDWLLCKGITPSRILVDQRANSTVGNAIFSMPILIKAGVKSVTLVSYESHLRRASILFLAAQLRIETAGVGAHPCGITYTTALAYPDKAIANTKASAATRTEIAAETAALLGLTNQYNAGL